MRALVRAFAVTAFALSTVLVVACGMQTANSEACLPGDFTSFTLSDGGAGFYQCLGDGSAYVLYGGPNPNTLPDAAVVDGGGDAAAACSTANGAKLGFMCSGCTTGADCETGDCFSFPNKGGNLCTRQCTPGNASTVCPAPSAGCGNNGNCKP